MSQVAFLVVFLLAFGKGKSVTTFGARDLDVWHIADSPRRAKLRRSTLFALRGASKSHPFLLAVGPTEIRKSAGAQTLAYGARVPKRLSAAEFTPSQARVQSNLKTPGSRT